MKRLTRRTVLAAAPSLLAQRVLPAAGRVEKYGMVQRLIRIAAV